MPCLNLAAVAAAALVCQVAPAQAPPTAPPDRSPPASLDEEFRLPADASVTAAVGTLIDRIGSPVFRDRAEAADRLVDVGAGALAQLRAAYRGTDRLEVRLRIEEIAGTIYLNHHVFDRNGFLGISQGRFPKSHRDDERIPEGHLGISVGRIIPDTAAEAAGIQEEDVIIALDGLPIPAGNENPMLTFGETIRLRGPGAKLRLTILRGAEQLDLDAVLRARPRRHYGLGQGPSAQMLETHRSRFPVWWVRHFGDATPEATNPGR